MPTKPDKMTIDAANKVLNPQDVLRVTIQETPELRDALLAAGIIKKADDKE